MMQQTNKLTGIITLFCATFFALAPAALAAEAPVEGGPAGTAQATKPVLAVTKTSDVSTVNPDGMVTYTITIKNTGDAAALGLKLHDTMPVVFSLTTTGKNEFDYTFMGQLDSGKTVSTSYSIRVAKDVAAGKYVNVATVSATNHDPVTVQANVDVAIPEVKGATTTVPPKKTTTKTEPAGEVLGASDTLTSTGAGQLDVFLAILGSGLVGAGIVGLRRTRKA